jgi:hypothetical protein
MKVTKVVVELKQGLPNYSSRTASLECVADEGENLDPINVINTMTENIKAAWNGQASSPKLPADLGKDDQPQYPLKESPKDDPEKKPEAKDAAGPAKRKTTLKKRPKGRPKKAPQPEATTGEQATLDDLLND